MTKTSISFALIALLSISTTAFAASLGATCDNPMLTDSDYTSVLTAVLSASIDYTTSYCKSIAANSYCCASTILDTFQSAAEDILDTLTTSAEARDTTIATAKDTTIPAIASNIEELKTQATAVLALLDAATDTLDSDSNQWTKDGSTTVITAINRIATYVTGSTLKADFTTYQSARATCLTAMIKLQASSWCLACNADYVAEGVVVANSAVESITFSTDMEDRLLTACYSYIESSVKISDLLIASAWTDTLVDALATALETIATADGTAVSFSAFTTALAGINGVLPTGDNVAVQTPTSCTSTACTWIYETMLSATGILDQTLATQGGATNTEIPSTASRRLLEKANRMLASNTWEADADDSGVSVSFPTDPAGVNPSGAMKLMSGLLCLGALFAALVL